MTIASRIRTFMCLALIAFFLFSCRENSAKPSTATPVVKSAECQTISHEQGETEICGRPQRIAVLGPFILEPLVSLGVQPIAFADQIQGHSGNYDNPSEQIPYLGDYVTGSLINVGWAHQPSLESLVKVNPDLILGANFNNANQYEALSEIGPTLMLTWDDTQANVRAIAQAVGQPEKAEPLLVEMDRKIEVARNTFADFAEENSNVLLISSSDLSQINLVNNAYGLCNTLLANLGFNLVSVEGVRENQSGVASVSLEALSQVKDVDAIVLLGLEPEGRSRKPDNSDAFREQQLSALKQAWKDNKLAQSFEASKASKVYFISAYLCAGLPGPIGTELYLEELRSQLLSNEP